MRVRLTPAAIGDIQQARDWYEKRSPGMGATVTQADEAIHRIAAKPESYLAEIERIVPRYLVQKDDLEAFLDKELLERTRKVAVRDVRPPEFAAGRSL